MNPQEQIATAVQGMLEDVGISAEIVRYDAATVTGEWRTGGYDVLMQVRTGLPTAGDFLNRHYTAPPGWLTEPMLEFVDAVTPAFDPTLSEAERSASLATANEIATEQAFDVFICAVPTQFAYADHVVGMESKGQSDFQGIFDLRYVGIAPH